MEYPISEMVDRITVLRIKHSLYKQEPILEELKKFESSLIKKLGKEKFVKMLPIMKKLHEINRELWDLVSNLKEVQDKNKGLEEMGRIYISQHIANKKRVSIKNKISEITGSGFKDIEVNSNLADNKSERSNFNPTFKSSLMKKGLIKFFSEGIRFIFEFWLFRLWKRGSFEINGEKLNYFYYPYNATWRNERAVEIPLIWREVKKVPPCKILEIGNVLGHYFKVKHDVLDKYEKIPRVINEDVVDFHSKKKYDLIVAISTLEHVGFDESPKDEDKVISAINNLKTMLTKGGKLLFTIPIGYNPPLDKKIFSKKIKLDEIYFMKRISKDNQWVQVKKEDVLNLKFENPFPRANGLMIGIIKG